MRSLRTVAMYAAIMAGYVSADQPVHCKLSYLTGLKPIRSPHSLVRLLIVYFLFLGLPNDIYGAWDIYVDAE